MRMSMTRGRPARFATLATILAVLVAACGSSSSGASGAPGIFGQQSPGASAASKTPVATDMTSGEAPSEATAEPTAEPIHEATGAPSNEPTAEPTGAASPSSSVDTGQLAEAGTLLSDLTSYRLELKMQGVSFVGTDASTPITMKATVILKPQRAMEFTISGMGMGDAGSDTGMTYVIIGAKAWMVIGGTSMEAPEGSAGSFDQMFESLAPDKLFGSQYGAYLAGMQKVGAEQKNGVATTHYRGSQASLEALARLAGGADMPFDVSDWTMDVWVAQDGGYLVGALQQGVIQSGETKGTYLVEMNISNINDPANKVAPPK
jgi:hypothetical protein